MIYLLDEITLDASEVPRVLALIDDEYLPGLPELLPVLLNRWVSPPVVVPDVPTTLWLLWQLPDVPSYYRMRANPGASSVVWPKLDRLCRYRRRHILTGADCLLPVSGELNHVV